MFKDNFSRYEFKFPLSYDDMDRLIDDLLPWIEPDEHVNEYGIYTISSIYLDNAARQCYYETINNDYFRQKVRLRVYGRKNTEDSVSFLEVKSKIDGLVVKRRVQMRLGDAMRFLAACSREGYDFDLAAYPSSSLQILKEIRQVTVSKSLVPVNVVSYERLPYVVKEDRNLRITFDFNIRTRGDRLDLTQGTDGKPACPEKVSILEIKTEKAIPFWLVQILGKYEYRNQTFSKYCSHYEAMRVRVRESGFGKERKGELKNVPGILKSVEQY